MPRLSFSSLRVRLILLILIAVIPALGLIIFNDLEQRRIAVEEAKLDALRLTQLAAGNFNNYVEGGRQLLMALSKISRVQRLDSAACNVYFTAILKENPLYLNIIGVDTAGYAFASGVPLKRPISYADRPWIQQAMKTRNFAVGDFALARATGRPSTFFAYPIIDERGVLRGALAASVNLDWLNQLAQEANLPTGATLTLVDRGSTILARYPDPEKWVGKIMPEATHIKTMIQHEEGIAEIAGIDGVQRIYAFTPVHGAVDTGFYMSIGISKEIAFKKINHALYRNLVILGVVAALALAAAWWGGNILLMRPVRDLLAATKKLKNGDLSARTGLAAHPGELSQLARDFNEMAAALEQRETARKESEERFRSAFENANVGVCLVGLDGKLKRVNNQMCEIFGYSGEELESMTVNSIVHPEDRDISPTFIQQASSGEVEHAIFEKRYFHKHGHVVWGQIASSLVRDSRGAPLYFISHILDITERKQAEDKLQESEKRFRALIENSSDAIALFGVDGKILYGSPATTRILGYELSEFEGRHMFELIHPEDHPFVKDCFNKSIRKPGEPIGVHAQVLHKSGHWRYLEGNLTNLLDDPSVRAIVNNYRDVTERKRAEEALRHAKQMYQELVENVNDIIYEADAQGIITYISPAIEQFSGYSALEVAGQPISNFVLPEYRPQLLNRFRAFAEGETGPTEYGIVTKSGAIKWARASSKPVIKEGRFVGVRGVLTDITEKKRAEKALRETTEKLRAVVQASPLAIIATDLEGKITMWNPAAERMFGWTEREILQNHAAPMVPEDQRQKRWEMRQRLLQGEIFVEDEAVRQRKDGSRIQVNIARAPLRDEQGKIVGGMAIITDITERKQLEAQLLQAQKMEAVGTLAGGVAHDFNNLLTAITVNVELAKAKVSKNKPVEPHLKEIEKVALRAAQLTSQLLSFSRRQLLQPVPLNLNDIITNLSNMLMRILGEHIELDFRLAGNLWVVKADPGHIEQVIMNLCVNARDAMPTGGRLTLKTQNIVLDENYAKEQPEFKTGDYVVLEVTDTGTGMNKATMERIFEPFFTTKEVGKGTGLGLSMVFGIVKQHEGHVNVYSEPGMGTTFKIYLPRIEEPVMVKETPQIIKKIIGGRETILVAEDEDPLRQAIREMLEAFGYTVLLARDGREAAEIYEREGERINLVLLDVVMPRMGGKDTAEFIQKLNPRQKILFSSGYSAEGIHESFMIPAGMQFIQKPYTAEELAQKVREVLES